MHVQGSRTSFEVIPHLEPLGSPIPQQVALQCVSQLCLRLESLAEGQERSGRRRWGGRRGRIRPEALTNDVDQKQAADRSGDGWQNWMRTIGCECFSEKRTCTVPNSDQSQYRGQPPESLPLLLLCSLRCLWSGYCRQGPCQLCVCFLLSGFTNTG